MNSSRPNILVIICHDLGQHLGAYGVDSVRTPNVDRLAETGVLFERSFCTHPTCSPSRASVFTGRYPHSNGVMGLTQGERRWRLRDDELHLAQILRSHDYDTALAGLYHEHTPGEAGRLGYSVTGPEKWDRTARGAADFACQYLSSVGASRSGSDPTPFFLCVGFFEPHRPYDHGGVRPYDTDGIWIPPFIPTDTPESETAAHEEFAALQGAVNEMDIHTGRILQTLEESGLSDSTVVLFTADHGIAMPGAKGALYDPGIQVPLIIRYPDGGIGSSSKPVGKSAAATGTGTGTGTGRRITDLVSNVDYVPTLLDLAGIPIPDRVQGSSLLPLLVDAGLRTADDAENISGSESTASTEERVIFAEKNFHNTYDPIRCVRSEHFSYIVNFEHGHRYTSPGDIATGPIFKTSMKRYQGERPMFELYDLEADPWQQRNLAGDPEFWEVEERLRRVLIQWMQDSGDPLLDGPIRSPYYSDALTTLKSNRTQ